MMLEMKTKNRALELKIFPMQQITSPSLLKDQLKGFLFEVKRLNKARWS